MPLRLSSFLVKSSSTSQVSTVNEDNESEVAPTILAREEPLPVPSLKVKRVDHYYSRWARAWKYRNMSSNITVETIPILHSSGTNDPWKDYAFVIVRKIPRQENHEPIFKIVVKSDYLLKACKDVIISWPGVSWNSDPLELEPDMCLTFFPEFERYRQAIAEKKTKSAADKHLHATVNLLLSSLATDYRTTLAKIQRLTSHSEITFDLLFAILVPRTIFVTKCAMTGSPRLFKLVSAQHTAAGGKAVYQLAFESVDLVDKTVGKTSSGVGRVETLMLIKCFTGTVKIQSLDAYPLVYHPDEARLRETVLRKGKKWVDLIGVHHRQYDGTAAVRAVADKVVKHNVKGRIMIDRATFRRLNPNHQVPKPLSNVEPENYNDEVLQYYDPNGRLIRPSAPPVVSDTPGAYANGLLVNTNDGGDDVDNLELTDEDLLLTSTVVFGFSLTDKIWLEFDVEKIQEIEWNSDAFENLVLPPGRKQLLQSLVEAHHRGLGFDDFIKGKGHGLVVNLFGPPGVGKTFSAEATSEHVRKPLYLIGGGDLGTKAADLDVALERIFDVATAWKAIVLIDEADVFLEQRSLHELERNAMVAVFLRHVEYYRGILFLTTNRVQAFDEAFLSRIHVALHFQELTQSSKEQVWTAFIRMLGIPASEISKEQIAELARRAVNGRQIKNAARTAQSLAVGRGEAEGGSGGGGVGYRHFVETLDALEGFQREFEGMRKEGGTCGGGGGGRACSGLGRC